MREFRWGNVDVLVVDPDRGARTSLRNMLFNNGFREVKTGASVADIHEFFGYTMPDLLIADAELADGELSGVIKALRQQGLGTNPFLPVIALTWSPTRNLVKNIINCGADDLVTKPISAAYLLERIRILIEARKPFIVTSDYIGPDRHRGSLRENKVQLVDVPNSLKAKATGESDANIEHAIAATVAEVNRKRLQQHAIHIVGIASVLTNRFEEGAAVDTTIEAQLQRLLYVTEDTERRSEGTGFSHITQLCHSLANVARGVLATRKSPDSKDLRLLKPLSQAIHAGLETTVDSQAAARMITDSVEKRQFFGEEAEAPQKPAAAPQPPAAAPAAREAAAEETAPAVQPPEEKKAGKERRYLFLLRLFASKVSHLFKESHGQKAQIPRQFVHGFDRYLRMLLGATLYEQLNGEAEKLLDEIDSNDDAYIWREVFMNEQYRMFSMNILVRILLKFKNFERSKMNFISIINSVFEESAVDVFTERHFAVVFSTLFSDIFGVIGDPEEMRDFDCRFGDGSSQRIMTIYDAFKEEMRGEVGAVFGGQAKVIR